MCQKIRKDGDRKNFFHAGISWTEVGAATQGLAYNLVTLSSRAVYRCCHEVAKHLSDKTKDNLIPMLTDNWYSKARIMAERVSLEKSQFWKHREIYTKLNYLHTATENDFDF